MNRSCKESEKYSRVPVKDENGEVIGYLDDYWAVSKWDGEKWVWYKSIIAYDKDTERN